MGYPYQRLLLFLVSRKVNVNEELDRYGLPGVGSLWAAKTKVRVRSEGPHSLAAYLDGPIDAKLLARDGILQWAETEGIYELWKMQFEFGGGSPQADLELAFRIFAHPYARALMGMFLFSTATDEEISLLWEEVFDLSLRREVLDIYRSIFWDISQVRRPAWGIFIKKLRTKEERHYLTLGLKSPTVDEVKIILGLKVAVEHLQIVDDIATVAYRLFMEASKQPLPDVAGLEKWGALALSAVKTKKQITKGDTDEDDLLLQKDGFKGLFSVQTTTSSHPTLADLQGHKPKELNAQPEKESGDG